LKGSDPKKMLEHYLSHGYAEGRRPCAQGSAARI
jgi:hypothetical protein